MLPDQREASLLSRTFKKASDKSSYILNESLADDGCGSSRFLRHHLAVFPHVNRRAVHLGGFSGRFSRSTQCAPDALHKPGVLRLPLCLHVTLSNSRGVGPELS